MCLLQLAHESKESSEESQPRRDYCDDYVQGWRGENGVLYLDFPCCWKGQERWHTERVVVQHIDGYGSGLVLALESGELHRDRKTVNKQR